MKEGRGNVADGCEDASWKWVVEGPYSTLFKKTTECGCRWLVGMELYRSSAPCACVRKNIPMPQKKAMQEGSELILFSGTSLDDFSERLFFVYFSKKRIRD